MQEKEIILKTETVRVRIMSLDLHETAAWHFHSEVTDDIFCLTGEILIRMKDPIEEINLSPGARYQIQNGRLHQLENMTEAESTYLLVQGVGKYDFIAVREK